MDSNKLKTLKYFCRKPFTSLYLMNFGEYKMCCDSGPIGSSTDSPMEVWTGERINSVRESFLKDEKHPACQTCWKREEQGIYSGRDSRPVNLSSGIDYPQELSIRTGNLCNLKCIMCTPFNSSKWQEDIEIYRDHVDRGQSYFGKKEWLESKEDLTFLSHAKHISFVGGEPLLTKSHQSVLDHLISIGRSSEVALKYFTNATFLPPALFEKWKHFKKLELRASIDGTAEVYEYIRHPAAWSEVEAHLVRLSNLEHSSIDFGINFLLMNLNVFELEKLFRWRDNREKHFGVRPQIRIETINEPQFLKIDTLDEATLIEFRESVERIFKQFDLCDEEHQHLNSVNIQIENQFSVGGELNSEKEAQKRSLKAYVKALDEKRNINSSHMFAFI